MIIWVASYCFLYLTLLSVGLVGIHRHYRKRIIASTQETISLKEITLIVPFRNEENRIGSLLDSILNSKELPENILFIDDHSTDRTVKVIESKLEKDTFQILNSDGSGKKAAIRTGIKNSDTPFVLTMDADVQFHSDYFTNLKQLKQVDLHILPVRMSADGWRKLFEMDVYMVNGINLIADGLFRPIVASGANLLFKKEAFNEVDSYSTHMNILSGDDQFLLADFNRAEKEIQLHSTFDLSVTTHVPTSLKELVYQRLRWILKTSKVPDSLALKIGFLQMITTFFFVGLSVCVISSGYYFLFAVLFVLKTLSDVLLAKPYFSGIKKQGLLFLIPVYELIFPIYTLLLAILSIFSNPTWKGRSIAIE